MHGQKQLGVRKQVLILIVATTKDHFDANIESVEELNGMNAEQLRKDYENKLAKLRKSCKHKKLSKWTDEWWAIAHSTGFQVRSCLNCEETIDRKTLCRICEKEIVNKEILTVGVSST
jgi:hypothetical protein